LRGQAALKRIGSRCTGKERDSESGLDYFGARYYSNGLGRWTSPDKPFADQHLQNPQSWNLYMYAANRPTSLIDTDGREVKEVTKTATYTVNGATANEAWSNAARAPGRDGYQGSTDWNIGVGHYDFSRNSNASGTTVTDTVTKADVNLTVTTTVPTWDGYKDASPDEQKQWDQHIAGTNEHEGGHKDIAEKAADALDKSLPGTTATGTGKSLPGATKDADTKLGAKIEDKHQATVNDAQAKSDRYDAKTQHGTHQERKNDPD
jgi:RHS repeat-associated protein